MEVEGTSEATKLIGILERWERAGGVWRVAAQRDLQVITVSLMRCDAGEVVERLSSSHADWRVFLARRSGSDT